jgi:hypothetical protein
MEIVYAQALGSGHKGAGASVDIGPKVSVIAPFGTIQAQSEDVVTVQAYP